MHQFIKNIDHGFVNIVKGLTTKLYKKTRAIKENENFINYIIFKAMRFEYRINLLSILISRENVKYC